MPRRAFGKYEVLARLATGGAASIFLARQPGAAGFHKLVCLKTLLPERASDADFVAMFLDEARLAARLNHPNCVQIYDLGRVRGVYYISMEYIFGETLWNLLTTVTRLRTPLPPAHVASIIAFACDGLNHAHELKDPNGRPYNLVHRDVSPQNIMITFEGQTKVVDFGIAKAETGRAPTVAGIVKGKFSYMSPEQITGGEVDRRSDIFSLGIVLFECLASRRLYRGDSPEEIAKLILEHRAPRLRDVVPEIPAPLDEVCARALSRHPSKRYADAADMADALRMYLDDVRFNQSTSTTAKLLAERFDGIAERRREYESALNGTYDEAQLLQVLDARAVREIDLFPDEDQTDMAEDFIDEAGTPMDPVLPNTEASSSKRQGPGWRVEIDAADKTATPEIQMLSDDAEELSASERTRIDPSGETAAAIPISESQIDPTRADEIRYEDRTQFDPDNTVQQAEATSVDIQAEELQKGSWGEATRETDLDHSVGDTPDAREPSYGGAAAIESNRLAEIVETRDDAFESNATIDAKDGVSELGIDPPSADAIETSRPTPPPPVITRSRSRSRVRNGSSGVEVRAAPAPVSVPPREVMELPTRPPEPVPLDPAALTPIEPASPPAGLATQKFSLAAVLAALGFGMSLGIVIGMVLARIVFGVSEPTQIPANPPSKISRP